MNIQFSDRAIDGATAALAADQAPQRCLFVLTPSEEECGVEAFARLLLGRMQSVYPDQGYGLLAVSGRWRDLPGVLRQVVRSDRIVFSVPLVAWKRLLLLP